MDRRLIPPTFPNPTTEYSQHYMFDLVRSINDFVTYVNATGELRQTTITLTGPVTPGQAGQLGWNTEEATLDIAMNDDVTQQVGLELYMRAKNGTGSTITNGTAVGFAGVNGDQIIEVAPYLADGATATLYFVGVATQDIAPNERGFITVWGLVRELNTSGFSVGNILYASPSTAGALTNIKPTAPDNVIPVAACVVSDASAGVIFVRPTIEQQLYYGTFSKTGTVSPAATNTAYAVSWDNTEIAEGVSIVSSSRITVANAGLYAFNVTFQVSSGSSNAKTVKFWFKKNGTNVTHSTRILTVDINSGYSPISMSQFFSLAVSDYIELFWETDDTNVQLVTVAAGTNYPEAPAGLLSVTQVQQ